MLNTYIPRTHKPVYSFSARNSFLSSLSFYSHSRDVIFTILNSLNLQKEDEIFLPDYTCGIMMETILKFNSKIKFYTIDESLSFNKEDVIANLTDSTKVFILIDYFGKQEVVSTEFYNALKNKGVVILRDAANSFLTCVAKNFDLTHIDYLCSSIYKSISVHAGAVLAGPVLRKRSNIDFIICLRGVLIKAIKRVFSLFGVSSYINKGCEHLQIYSEVNYNYKVSNLNIYRAYRVLLGWVNFKKIIRNKKVLVREYYKKFKHLTNVKPVFEQRDIGDDVLQEFPLVCKDVHVRDNLLNEFRNNHIDAHTWPSFHISNVNEGLWKCILIIPIHKTVLSKLNKILNV